MLKAIKNGYVKVDAFMNKHQNKIWLSLFGVFIIMTATFLYLESTRDIITITITK